ncbi:hypothetical protein [Lentzea sp. NPDC004782]|uniref:hypothetical protein n=1 Tax=Lentzea sp. NPDC004782 TaxID=3154458 RepID=UPI0033AEAE1A
MTPVLPAFGHPCTPGCAGGFGVPGGAGLGVVVTGATELEEGAALDDSAALLDVADVVAATGWASPDFAPAGEQATRATASAAKDAMREDRCRRGARRSFCLALPLGVAVR